MDLIFYFICIHLLSISQYHSVCLPALPFAFAMVILLFCISSSSISSIFGSFWILGFCTIGIRFSELLLFLKYPICKATAQTMSVLFCRCLCAVFSFSAQRFVYIWFIWMAECKHQHGDSIDEEDGCTKNNKHRIHISSFNAIVYLYDVVYGYCCCVAAHFQFNIQI